MSPRSISENEFMQREAALIQLARALVEKDCLTTLTIDKLVAASAYSKGTIYKHFSSKEDLLTAICNSCTLEIQTLFKRALEFNGNSREKVIAVLTSYIIWAKLHPTQLFVVLSAHSPTVVNCTSEARNQTHQHYDAELMGLLNNEISKAIESGDLTLPAGMCFEQVTFAMWSSSWGAMALITSIGCSPNLHPMQLERDSFTNASLILDGLGWKPLSQNWDYAQSIKKIAHEIFQPEIAALEAKGTPFIFI